VCSSHRDEAQRCSSLPPPADPTPPHHTPNTQERKRALASGAFGGIKTRDDIRRMRLDDLRLLMA
jgi:hypothetical protein